jgi:hypothetical protein
MQASKEEEMVKVLTRSKAKIEKEGIEILEITKYLCLYCICAISITLNYRGIKKETFH